ncbi:MAG: P27 family phage terminase small subunit [Bacteroidales bacterium]|nr:P27 family phage terminase small subunit [Bacteroidales bacterium]
MNLKEKIIDALGDEYKPSDDITIERLIIYYDIFKEAAKDVKAEGYRRRVSANAVPGVREATARYFMNIAFMAMNDAAKHIRADIELLGLSKKGKKIELTTKLENTMSLLDKINNIPDE